MSHSTATQPCDALRYTSHSIPQRRNKLVEQRYSVGLVIGSSEPTPVRRIYRIELLEGYGTRFSEGMANQRGGGDVPLWRYLMDLGIEEDRISRFWKLWVALMMRGLGNDAMHARLGLGEI